MAEEQAKMMRIIPWVLGPLGILVTMNMAASVQLYLAMTAILQYFQTSLFHMAWVRRACGLPPLETLIENPKYQQQQRHRSPFSNRADFSQGVRYEAPRTIGTTATEGGAANSNNPFEYFKGIVGKMREAKGGMTDKIVDWRDKQQVKKETRKKLDWESKRFKADNDSYMRRREQHLKQQQQQQQQRKK